MDGHVFWFGIFREATSVSQTGQGNVLGRPQAGIGQGCLRGNSYDRQHAGGQLGGCPVSEILVTLVFDRHCHVDGVLRGILGNIDGIWLSWEVEFVDDFLGGQVHDRELAGDVDIVQGGIYAHDGYRRR
jgi:hypothetical protein